MRENLVDDRLVLDRGNDSGLAAADPASLYIDVEDPLESLRLCRRKAPVDLVPVYSRMVLQSAVDV